MPFRFNPFTDRLDLAETGGGGAGTVDQLTPDIGGAVTPDVNGNINVFGQKAGIVPVMTTRKSGSNFLVENRTWLTQYVVDTNNTAGLEGTFTTIQAAMDQAMADGMAFNNQKVIELRNTTYTEDLVIRPGAILQGTTLSNPTGGLITPLNNTLINGSHTFSGNAICGFNNIVFTNDAGDLFSGGAGAICLLYFDNCLFAKQGTEQIFNSLPINSYISTTRCTYAGPGDSQQITLSGVNLSIDQCTFAQPLNITVDSGDFFLNDTTGVGVVTLTTGTAIFAYFSTFSLGGTRNYCIDSTAGSGGVVFGCHFNCLPAIAALSHCAASGNPFWLIGSSTIGARPGGSTNTNLYETGALVKFYGSSQGNILCSRLVTGADVVAPSDYYIGISSIAAPFTLTLNDSSSGLGNIPNQNQTFIIKDQSGNAGVNNVTITTNSGTATIDGSTTLVLNAGYQSVTLIFDGTNYFIL